MYNIVFNLSSVCGVFLLFRTTSSSVNLTPLTLSPVYNGLLTRKMCFSQGIALYFAPNDSVLLYLISILLLVDVLDGFVDNIQSILLEASIHYQPLSGGLFSGSKKQVSHIIVIFAMCLSSLYDISHL